MDWSVAAAEWKHFRNEVRATWGELTDSELEAIAGDRVCLGARIRATYRLTSEQAEQQIRNFEARNEYFRAVSLR